MPRPAPAGQFVVSYARFRDPSVVGSAVTSAAVAAAVPRIEYVM